MERKFSEFKALVLWLAHEHHEGHIYPMAERTGISHALLDRWSKGMVKNPTAATIEKLCQAYELNFHEVMDLATRGRPTTLRRLRMKVAVSLLTLALSIASMFSVVMAQSIVSVDLRSAPYRKLRAWFVAYRWFIVCPS